MTDTQTIEQVVEQIESRINDFVGDMVEITNGCAEMIEPDVQHTAVIIYDGVDVKGYTGSVTFSHSGYRGGQIEDFKVHNLTGRGYPNRDFVFADEE